jgi:hypothetical protein
MATTVNLRKLLDRKTWEMMTPAPTATAAGSFIVSSTLDDQLVLYMNSVTVHYLYDPYEDSWLTIPASGLAGTFGAGSCGAYHPNGPTGTASAGGATTLTTTLTLPGSLKGYKIRITGGTGAGQERTIDSNTFGANSVITVSSSWSVNPDNTSTYMIQSGRFWIFIGNNATQGLRYYDVATNTWSSALSVTGVTATFATDGVLKATPGAAASFATGTATSATSTTLVNSAKTWTSSQWINYQVRITSGTGAGQVRTITANTGTTLTVATWTVTPDATSVYVIEGNDDFLYLAGNAAVALFRYSISGNTWSTLSPGAARAGAPGAGMAMSWIREVTDSAWTSESVIQNGRYLYSFRGAGGAVLDYYDIPGNTWVSGVSYMRSTETFTTGSSHEYVGDYFYSQKDATGRLFRYDIAKRRLDPWVTLLYPQGAAVIGDKMWECNFNDGGTKISWIYLLRNTGTELFRCMVI